MIPLLGPLAPLAGRFGIYVVIALGSFAAGLWMMSRWDEGIAARAQVAQDAANFAQIKRNTDHERTATQSLQAALTRARSLTADTHAKVPAYVPPAVDRACNVPDAFGELHDAAAAQRVPGDPREFPGSARGITLSAVAGTVIENYGTCHEWRHRLVEMIAWARKNASR